MPKPLNYLRLSGRSEEQIALVEAYAKAQGLWHDAGLAARQLHARRSNSTWATCSPSLAGPKRPQDRVLLEKVQDNFHANLEGLLTANRKAKKTELKRFDAEGGDQPQAEHLAAKPKSKIRIARPGLRSDRRLGGDRRDHVLHQHLQSGRDARRRPARAQRGASWASRPSRG